VSALSVEERRATALALAITSPRSEVLLVEEPLAMLDPVAPRLVVDALRRRAASTCVVVTTASARDAVLLADRLAILTAGVLASLPSGSELGALGVGPHGTAAMRVVVSAASGKNGAAALAGILGADGAVLRVETTAYGSALDGAHAVVVTGREPAALARAVTHAAARAGVEVDWVEPRVHSVDAIRAALAAREASPGAPPPRSAPLAPPEGEGPHA
jgi:energy-coupling factor transporter ATP-binding protein EcfA2